MTDKKATTAIFIDKWHPKKDGKCAISIRVTFNRQKRYFLTEHTLTPADFAKVQGDKPRQNFKEIAISLQAYEKRAADIITQLSLFTFEAFEKKYYTNTGANDSLSQVFENRIQEYKDAGQIGTSISYNSACVSLNKFTPGVKFADVNPGFLEKYEKWMLMQGNSKTTIGIYLRNLRALFNSAISDGIISKEIYPFGKRKYEIPTSKNVKKALSLNEVEMIFNYEAIPGTTEAIMKDYWIFLYLCNGMNVKDFALLQYKNLKDDVLEFERAKTTNTKRDSEQIRVMLSKDAQEIIVRHGNKYRDKETYIFPILSKGLAPIEIHKLIQNKVGLINEHIDAIAKKLGISQRVTSYVARHSFATVMQRSGATDEFIGKALGHGNTGTTRAYLAGFDDEHKRDMAKALTAWKS